MRVDVGLPRIARSETAQEEEGVLEEVEEV